MKTVKTVKTVKTIKNMKSMKSINIFCLMWLPLLVIACTTGSDTENTVQLQGQTMGTTWHVTIVQAEHSNTPLDTDSTSLQQLIETELQIINQQFSTYINNSEISLFNASKSTQPFNVSKEVAHVITAAQMISKESQGAFDISVAPLVELWGFGSQSNDNAGGVVSTLQKPSRSAILKVIKNSGYQHLKVQENPSQIIKNIPNLRIDLSAIAKGYGVDQLAELMEAQGFNNYLVDIGGEIKVKGHNSRGKLWHIAIEKPVSNAQIVQQIIKLKDISVATSGDYHNYFEENGVKYSHTIDPKTGSPVTHNLVSVTVLHESAMMADGLATAILVLGEQKGLIFANQKGLQVYMIVRASDGDESGKDFTFISTLSADTLTKGRL